MAEAEAAEAGGKGLPDLLKKKIGPLPAVVWIGLAIAVYLYMRKKNAGTAGTGPQTDPAGNVGTIDPQTGYVYGSSQDQSALGSSGGGTGTGTDTGTGGSTVAGTYSDNLSWQQAAVNYLVSIGEDAVASNSAISQYLASQPLTTNQQALVNLAIQRIGSPPSPPTPGTAPPPVVTPPSPGQVYATNPPTGVAVAPASSTSLNVKWNRSTNAQGYTVKWGTSATAATGSTTVSGTAGTTTISGLKANTKYYVQVQATPAKAGAAFATASATTSKAATGGGSAGGGTSAPKSVRAGENGEGNSFSAIASKWHVPGGGMALYQYQLTTPAHTAQAKQEIKQRGPNNVVVGEEVFLPSGSHA